jgi:hypothetical protein
MANSTAFVSTITIHKDGTETIFGRLGHEVCYKIKTITPGKYPFNVYLDEDEKELKLIISAESKALALKALQACPQWQENDAEDFLLVWRE